MPLNSGEDAKSSFKIAAIKKTKRKESTGKLTHLKIRIKN